MQHWVFIVGTRDEEPPIDWLAKWPHHIERSYFAKTKRPVAVSRGDRALVYGSKGRGFIGAIEVLSDHPEAGHSVRYPWSLRHRLLVSKPADHHVASPQDAGINPNKVVRGPHSRISPDEYRAGLHALTTAAERSAS